jgi:hypothetical protein
MKKNSAVMALVLLFIAGGLYLANKKHAQNPGPLPATPSSTHVTSFSPDKATKTSDCKASSGLPDHACTPGAVITSATKNQICVPGYSKTVRNVPVQEKQQVYKEYGISYPQPQGSFEVDHLISLELGGSNDIANLWPEAALPVPGFHQKDSEENYLHDQVCTGAMTLPQAQKIISTNWLEYYKTMPKPNSEFINPVQ